MMGAMPGSGRGPIATIDPDNGDLTEQRLIEALTSAPAGVIAQPIGSLSLASGAVVIDPLLSWQACDANWQSVGRNSLFAGQTLSGRVIESV